MIIQNFMIVQDEGKQRIQKKQEPHDNEQRRRKG